MLDLARLLPFVTLICLSMGISAQAMVSRTVTVNGSCLDMAYELIEDGEVDGRPAFTGTGNFAGTANTPLQIYWDEANMVWIFGSDGAVFSSSSADTPTPPSTETYLWTANNDPCPSTATPFSVTGDGAALPVTYSYFRATLGAKSEAILNWSTTAELDNAGFAIQKRDGDASWLEIGWVPAGAVEANARGYSFTDFATLEGTNLYRLEQRDFDGTTALSKIVSVHRSGIGADIVPTPNPISTDEFRLYSSGGPGETGSLKIFSLQGRLLKSASSYQIGHHIDVADLPGGTYLITFSTEKGIQHRSIIIKR